MKRNLIEEITSIKERAEFNSRHNYGYHLDKIESTYKEIQKLNGDSNEEFLKYIPIATIACFEAFFRSIVKELIDFGKPYSENTKLFNQSKNVKFDFDIVNAIQKKTVSIGEFISHILSFNNFDDINSNFSTLIGTDFVNTIKEFEGRIVILENSKLFINNSNQIFSDVKKTYELRHIFCHEFATNFQSDKTEIFRCFNNSRIFLQQINDFIWDLLYPNAPTNQSELNEQSAENYEKIDLEFSILIEKIKEISKEHSYLYLDENLFADAIKKWKAYRDAWAKSMSAGYEGGRMYHTIYPNSLTKVTKGKLEELKSDFEMDLKKYINKLPE